MKLRYIVELKTRPTFTVTKEIKSEIEAEEIINKLKKENKKEGYMKNSGFTIYKQ